MCQISHSCLHIGHSLNYLYCKLGNYYCCHQYKKCNQDPNMNYIKVECLMLLSISLDFECKYQDRTDFNRDKSQQHKFYMNWLHSKYHKGSSIVHIHLNLGKFSIVRHRRNCLYIVYQIKSILQIHSNFYIKSNQHYRFYN